MPDTLAYEGFKKSAVMNEQKKRKRKKKKFGAMHFEVLPEESHAKEKIGNSEANAEHVSPEQTKALSKSDLKHASAEEPEASDDKVRPDCQICCRLSQITASGYRGCHLKNLTTFSGVSF